MGQRPGHCPGACLLSFLSHRGLGSSSTFTQLVGCIYLHLLNFGFLPHQSQRLWLLDSFKRIWLDPTASQEDRGGAGLKAVQHELELAL